MGIRYTSPPHIRQHLTSLKQLYGDPLLLSLLDHKGDEAELASAFVGCVRILASDPLEPLPARVCAFDFHANAKTSKVDGLRALVAAIGSDVAVQVRIPHRPDPSHLSHTRSLPH